MKRDLKVLLTSIGLGSLFMVLVHLGLDVVSYEMTQSEKVANLGIPQVVSEEPVTTKRPFS